MYMLELLHGLLFVVIFILDIIIQLHVCLYIMFCTFILQYFL
ncbi:E5 [Canis familiaris papillomavirus 2]|uniref:E5 n=1 Tax=Canis familiaris papillomavirus 2 TaxID=292792 RepID=Q647H7_9PAPI|nr:E5 [Canis familiaris papillomavirus 2]AAU21229.1 E5 [Canis familiaris papillomavirus 2]UVN22519.1 CPV2 gp6 [Canis familiaris papillomavirus 2]BBC43196.1 E5 protein [Canis familiaris papillomavirus 2]